MQSQYNNSRRDKRVPGNPEKGKRVNMENERFWIDTSTIENPFGEHTLGIVDEKAGGIIIYVNSEKVAGFIIKVFNGAWDIE